MIVAVVQIFKAWNSPHRTPPVAASVNENIITSLTFEKTIFLLQFQVPNKQTTSKP